MMENNVKKETSDDSINVTETTEEISDFNEGVVVKVEELHHSIEIEDDFIMEAESTMEDSSTCKSCENIRKHSSGSRIHVGKKPNTLENCCHKHLKESPPLQKNSHDNHTNKNMSFKIIQTTESGHKLPQLIVVPATWENNGTLHWPKYASTMVFIKLIQDGFSRPQQGWESLPCVKVRDSYLTYSAAAAERDELVLRSNNAAYQVNSQSTNFKKRLRSSDSTEIGCSPQKSFNSMTESARNLQNQPAAEPQVQQPILVVADVTPETRNITAVRSEPSVNILSQQRIPCPKQPILKQVDVEQQLMLSSIPQEIISSSCDMEIDGLLNGCEIYVMDEKQSNALPLADKTHVERNNKNSEVSNSTVVVEGNAIKMLLENQQHILDQQRKIFEELAKQHTTLEFLCGVCNKSSAKQAAPPPVVQQIVPRNDSTLNLLPLDTTEKLQELELFLLDGENMNRMVEKMSAVCGTSGKMNGINCCYTLIDSFFNREFLTKFSWSGGSRNSEEKAPFKNNMNIIKVFYKIVALADRQFSELECQGFFKSIVKNAKRRAQLMCSSTEKKRCSAGKRRPTNLIYNKYERRNDNDNEDENAKTENHYIYIENQDSNSESEQESNNAD